MASTEMLPIDHSWIFSPPVTPRNSSNLSLHTSLNSQVDGPVLSSTNAPTVEELNQINAKLTEVQLFSAEELKDDEFAAHNVRHEDAHGFVQDTSVSCLPRLRRDGGVPILLDFTNAVFQSFEDTSSDDANKTPSTTMDGKAHGSGDDATTKEFPAFDHNGWDPTGHTSFDVALTQRTSGLSSRC